MLVKKIIIKGDENKNIYCLSGLRWTGSEFTLLNSLAAETVASLWLFLLDFPNLKS